MSTHETLTILAAVLLVGAGAGFIAGFLYGRASTRRARLGWAV